MSNGLKNNAGRKLSTRDSLVAWLALWALLLAVLPVSALSADRKSRPKELVYCPLSKKHQPIKPSETKKEKEPFDAICASKNTKDFLFHEIVLKTPWRVFTVDAKDFENLIFDYLAHGRSALDELPFAPNAPSKKLIERAVANIASNNGGRHKFIWQHSAATAAFSLNFKARPPTADDPQSFLTDPLYRSAILSLRPAPRAPPLFS